MYKCHDCGEVFTSRAWRHNPGGTSDPECPNCESWNFKYIPISTVDYVTNLESIVKSVETSKSKTGTNKIYSSVLIAVGVVSIFIDGDITPFIMSVLMGVPIFFAKENLFV